MLFVYISLQREIAMKHIILLVICAIVLSSCATSLIYSPSTKLPSEPIKKNEIITHAGLGAFPETRPSQKGRYANLGVEAFVTFGISDDFALQGKIWFDNYLLAEFDPRRTGISITGYINLSDLGEGYHWVLIPSANYMAGDGSISGWIDGQGYAFLFGFWFPNKGILFPYASTGPIYGTHNFEVGQWGVGAQFSIGTAIRFSSYLEANIELPCILQYNHYDQITHFIPAPSIGFSLCFR